MLPHTLLLSFDWEELICSSPLNLNLQLKSSLRFNPDCQLCPRLTSFLDQIRLDYPDYHAKPVPAFGEVGSRLLIVGLAPGMHGANATGRPFTGDYAGILLYETLYRFGFSNQSTSIHRNDGLELSGCRITNAVKCLPPANKPVSVEVNQCNSFLKSELDDLPDDGIVLALGTIAHKAIVKAMDLKQADYRFAHDTVHRIADKLLIDSYHCSRYNVQTGRLTTEMFHQLFDKIKILLDE